MIDQSRSTNARITRVYEESAKSLNALMGRLEQAEVSLRFIVGAFEAYRSSGDEHYLAEAEGYARDALGEKG